MYILTKDYGPVSVKLIRHLLWYCWPVCTQFSCKCCRTVANLTLKRIWVSCMTFAEVPAVLLPGKHSICLSGSGRILFLVGLLTSTQSGSTQIAGGAWPWDGAGKHHLCMESRKSNHCLSLGEDTPDVEAAHGLCTTLSSSSWIYQSDPQTTDRKLGFSFPNLQIKGANWDSAGYYLRKITKKNTFSC